MRDFSDFHSFKASWLPDEQSDEFETAVEADKASQKRPSSMQRLFAKQRRLMYQCPSCGCLFIEGARGSLWRFTPAEAGTPKVVLRSLTEKGELPG